MEEFLYMASQEHPECRGRNYNWCNGCYVCDLESGCKKLPLFQTIPMKTNAEADAEKQQKKHEEIRQWKEYCDRMGVAYDDFYH